MTGNLVQHSTLQRNSRKRKSTEIDTGKGDRSKVLADSHKKRKLNEDHRLKCNGTASSGLKDRQRSESKKTSTSNEVDGSTKILKKNKSSPNAKHSKESLKQKTCGEKKENESFEKDSGKESKEKSFTEKSSKTSVKSGRQSATLKRKSDSTKDEHKKETVKSNSTKDRSKKKTDKLVPSKDESKKKTVRSDTSISKTTNGHKNTVKKKKSTQETSRNRPVKKLKSDSNKTESLTATNSSSVIPSDPMAMLLMMEGMQNGLLPTAPSLENTNFKSMPSTSTPKASTSKKGDQSASKLLSDSESEEGMSDWEEVHDHSLPVEKSQLPDQPVEITLEMPAFMMKKKRKKKAFDWKGYLQRRVKRFKKEVAIDMHKVHLLCLLSVGMRQNKILNDDCLQAVAMSLLPVQLQEKSATPKMSTESFVSNILSWYKRNFPLSGVTRCTDLHLVKASSLTQALSQNNVSDARVWVYLFVCFLRVVGLNVRLVVSFQPMPFKVSEAAESKADSKKSKAGSSRKGNPAKIKSTKSKSATTAKGKKSEENKSIVKSKPSCRSSIQASEKILKSLEDGDDLDVIENGDSELSEEERKHVEKIKQKRKSSSEKEAIQELSSDSDFDISANNNSRYFSPAHSYRKDLKIGANRKVVSDSSDDEDINTSQSVFQATGHDFWIEVFFPSTKKWMCLDCFKSQFGKPYSLENSATQPISYVLGFRNDGSVKDVTARYAKQWLSHTRKSRVDPDWWMETLMYFDLASVKENNIEDDEIKGQLLVRPMPTSIADFKNHPLYALKRHLLKFEAIYPDTAIPLGYIKKEPVYARECVRTLHSRDNWLKEGRLVRLKEEPYKMVKSRPKWNKPKENPEALDLELYGKWQTEEYIPLPAVDGKVPKNEYGNVELFKPWMLPKGTVQIRGQGMQRVAKKLGIDIAPAMIGWDHHSGYAHPVMDGWVVCEEFADTLLCAWDEDQEIQKQREQEKREKRVYGNWRLLIRGLLIKQKLKTKFSAEEKKGVKHVVKEEEVDNRPAKTSPSLKADIDEKKPAVCEITLPTRTGKEQVKPIIPIENVREKTTKRKGAKNSKKTATRGGMDNEAAELGMFSGKREIVDNLNISEDSDDGDDDFEVVSEKSEEDGEKTMEIVVTEKNDKGNEKDTISQVKTQEKKRPNGINRKKALTKRSSVGKKKSKAASDSNESSESENEDEWKKSEIVSPSAPVKRSARAIRKQINYSEIVDNDSGDEFEPVKAESESSSEDEKDSEEEVVKEEVKKTVRKTASQRGRKRAVK